LEAQGLRQVQWVVFVQGKAVPWVALVRGKAASRVALVRALEPFPAPDLPQANSMIS
jgi:hypothetical protein